MSGREEQALPSAAWRKRRLRSETDRHRRRRIAREREREREREAQARLAYWPAQSILVAAGEKK
jgi:hypothetical protein